LVLHLIAILISENIFLWHIVAAFIIFVSVAVFGAVFLFQSPKTIATALITSRLDYCNPLLYNIAYKDIVKLQCVQNCLARFVARSPRFSHSVPLLKSLHWSISHSNLFSGFPPAPKARVLHSSYFHLSVSRVKIMMGLALFQLFSILFGIHSLNILSHQMV